LSPKPEIMICYRIDGLGPVPSFKNGKQIIRVGGSPRLITRPDRRKWMQAAEMMIRAKVNRKPELSRAWEKRETPKGKDRIANERKQAVCVRVALYISSLGTADPDGALATIMDVLVKSGALADDSPRYVKSAAVHWFECPKGQEGAQISITLD